MADGQASCAPYDLGAGLSKEALDKALLEVEVLNTRIRSNKMNTDRDREKNCTIRRELVHTSRRKQLGLISHVLVTINLNKVYVITWRDIDQAS